MPRIRHIGGHGSILTAKGGKGAAYEGAAWTPRALIPRFNVFGVVNNARGICVKPDGTRFYVLLSTDDTIHEFRLAKKWRVDSAVYVGSAVLGTMGTAVNLAFKPDGTAVYVTDSVASAAIRQYSLSTPWDLSTLSYVGVKLVNSQSTSPGGMAFKPDGTKLMLQGGSNIYEYTLSTPWLVSTATYVGSSGFLSPGYSVALSPDGTRLFHDRGANGTIADYTLGNPWSVGGTNTANNPVLSVGGIQSFFYREDGKALYAMDINGYLNQFGGV
ncbi:hypothetical protein AKG11_10380 [Shinella sp. SUS2]|uniref:YncE family protein n=1 Tax=unclassified Shinella TaxID=2643062 RepID=UPI00068231BC|nr:MULTISPECIES: WD40 repeat domain-containing protein [unclassified Shinella]KNY16758.1 hypothetical protein AKG11_10380 [Shinella sp. SUS2]KOC73236.1 hypothetical protein AKG10_22680 [Shinella sp. GWS1]